MKNIFKRATALLLSLLMVFSVCSTSLIIYATDGSESLEYDIEKLLEQLNKYNDDKTVNYVSLGDSMTNGYGMEGYNHNSGVADYAYNAYPNQFAQWLLDSINGTYAVDHAQLSMSGIRTEDIHWLLEFDYTNADLIKVVDEFVAENNKKDEVWDQDKWEQYFGCGDYWTVNEICNHSRTNATFAHIAGVAYNDGTTEGKKCTEHAALITEFPTTYNAADGISMGEKVAVIAKYYQEHVAAADIISLSVGNGNIGVFGFGRILETIGFQKTTTYLNYNYEDVLRECEPEMQVKLLALIDEIKPSLLTAGYSEDLVKVALYIAVSLAMNYAGTLDAILQKNSDVEIILMPVMNTFGDPKDGFAAGSLGAMMEYVVEPINKFIAALPTYMQVTNHGVYEDAKFYYAEPGFVECMVDTYKYPLSGLIRDRFVESIVGEDGDGMIWGMLKGNPETSEDDMVVDITGEDISGYEQALAKATHEHVKCGETCEEDCDEHCPWDEENEFVACDQGPDTVAWLNYVLAHKDKMQSIVIYLAFEDAIVRGKNATVYLDSVMGLGGGLSLDDVMTDYAARVQDGVKKHTLFVCGALANATELTLESKVNDLLKAKNFKDAEDKYLTVDLTITTEQIMALISGVDGAADALAAAVVADLVDVFDDVYAAKAAAGAQEAVDTLLEKIESGVNEKLAQFAAQLSAQLGVPVELDAVELNALGYMNEGIYPPLKELDANMLAKTFYLDATDGGGFGALVLAPYVGKALNEVLGNYANTAASMGLTGAAAVATVMDAMNDEENAEAKAAFDLAVAAAGVLHNADTLLAPATEEYLDQMISEFAGVDVTAKAYVASEVANFVDASTATLLCTLLATPDALSGALQNPKNGMDGLLALFARCVIGNGLGAHPSAAGHNTLAAAVINAYANDNTAEDKTDANIDFKDLPVVKAIISYLTACGYLNDDQIIDIAFYAYGLLKDGMTDGEEALIANKVYASLFKVTAEGQFEYDKAFDADRIEIIGNVYAILNDYYDLNVDKNVAAFENVVNYLYSNTYLDDEQAFAIVNFVYWKINDGIQGNDVMDIIAYVYVVLFGYTPIQRARGPLPSWYPDSSIPNDQKLNVLMDMIGIFTSDSAIVAEYPELVAIEELVNGLTDETAPGGAILTDEELFDIIDIAVKSVVVEGQPPEVAVEDITTKVQELPADKQLAVLEKVGDTLGSLETPIPGIGGEPDSSNPMASIAKYTDYLAILKKVVENLKAEGLWSDVSDAKFNALTGGLITKLLNNETIKPMDIVDDAYIMLFDQPGQSLEDKIRVVVVIYETLDEEGVIDNAIDYVDENYYQEAMKEVLTDENIDAAIKAINTMIAAINAAKPAVNALDVTPGLKDALIAELDATIQTLETARDDIIAARLIKDLDGVAKAIFILKDELDNHANKITALATEAGIFAMPYIQYALAEINKYVDLAAEKAQEAYDWCVANVQQFAADYLALVETIGAEVDKIDPALGAAVRKFMIETPADTLAILYTYGDKAVDELVDRAIVYGDAVAQAAIKLAEVLKKYGVAIYNAIINDSDCKELYAELLDAANKILALEEKLNKPSDFETVGSNIYAELDTISDYALDLAVRFYNAAIAAVKADDYLAGTELEEALTALVAALATIDDEAIDYGKWIADHAAEMGGALLTAFLANWDELYEVAAPIIIREAKNIYNQVKDYILNYDYEALIQQIIDAAIKFAPELDAKLYDYFYNNPDEVIAFFNEYGDEIVDLCKKYGAPVLAVIGVALAAYGPELADYIINNPEEVLAGLSAWAEKYGDRVVAILQVYAEALGICDAVRNEIEDLKAELAALQAQLAVLNEQLKTATGEVRDAIEAEIARVQAEIAKVQAKIAELQQKLQNLVNAIYNLNDALKKFATEAIEFATAAVVTAIANLENAVKELLDSVSDDVADRLRDLIKNGVGLTIDLLADLAKLAVDAAIKFAPELDEYLYNYFYNNPEEVIAFFNEYGDEIIELCKRYGDKALGIIAIALAYAGPELAEYIINNPKEVLEGLSAWADKYGAKVVAILQVYAEALGLCDAVRGEVAELNNKLAALQAELMNQLNILQNELQAELDALYAQLENATEAAKVIILEKIKEIESKIELVQKYIAELQAKIAELQVKIAEINAKLQALIDALYNLDDALKALLETGVEAGVAAVQKALNEVANAVRDVIGVISDDIAAQIDKLLQKAKDYLNDAYHSAIIADYVINSNSNYVALGDNEEYAKLFAQYLKDTVAAENVGYNYKVNTALVQNGSKISTLPVIINENLGTIAAADLISIGYSFDKVAEDTILMAIELLMDGKTSVPTDYDWATIVGAEAAAEIEKLVGEIYTYMLNEGLGITVSEATSGMFDHNVTIADIAIIAVQYFVYNVVEYAAYLPQAVNAISQINPDAIIMINAISNPISGAKLSFFGQELVFGDYLDYVCDAMLVETAVLAAIYENVVFVPTTEIETTFTNRTISFNSSKDFIALAELLTALMENQAINTTPNGNAYACQKMTEALNITVEDGGLLGDVNGDGVVDYIDAILILRYEVGFVDPKFIAGVADVDRDGYIGYVDAIWVLKYEAGLEKEFPASK